MLRENANCRIQGDGGQLTISRKVVRALIQRIVLTTPGVVQLGGHSVWKRLFKWLGLRLRPRGMQLELAESEVAMTLTLVVMQGTCLTGLVGELRQRLRRSLKHQLGLDVRTINVRITSLRGHAPIAQTRVRDEHDPFGPAEPNQHKLPVDDLDIEAKTGIEHNPRFDLDDVLGL